MFFYSFKWYWWNWSCNSGCYFRHGISTRRKKFSALDMAGLAQKGGSVWSHMIISEPSKEINSPRIPNGDSDVLLGCDLVVSASKKLGKFFLRILFVL